MKKTLFALLISTSTLLVPTMVTAEVVKVEANGEYVMGDNDNKSDARKMALEHAKRSAAEQAGSYLESSTLVKDGMLSKDEIVSFTSAVLKTDVISEAMVLLDNKTTMFSIKIAATVDTSSLEKNISELKDNTKLKSDLLQLQASNKLLLAQLEEVSKQLNTKDVKGLRLLRDRREDLFSQIDKNNNAINITFARGTLANIAESGRKSLDTDKANIDEVLTMIANSTMVSLGEPQVHIGPSPTGRRGPKKAAGYYKDSAQDSDEAQLIVPISWETRGEVKEQVNSILEDLCDESRRKVDIESIESTCTFRNKVYSSELRDYINHRVINITVTVGEHNKKVQRFGSAGSEAVSIDMNRADLENISKLGAKVAVEHCDRKIRKISF